MKLGQTTAFLLVGLLTAAAVSAQRPAETGLPDASRPVSVAPGGRATFTFNAAANDFLHIVIERESLDVTVRLTDPDGSPVDVASRVRAQTFTDLLLLIGRGGVHRLELSVAPAATGARQADAYRASQRQATVTDHRRLAADAVVIDAARLQNAATAESRRAAIIKYEEAIALWQAIGDDRGAADAANRLGQVHQTLGDLSRSAETHMRAAAWFEKAGSRRGVGEATGNAGVAYRGLGKLDEALRAQQVALGVARELGNQKGQAYAMHNLGAVFYARAEYAEALTHYEQALVLKRAIGDRTVPITLSNMAATKSRMGLKREALAIYREVADLRRAQGDRGTEGADLHNIGSTLIELEEWEPALAALHQSLPLFVAAGNRVMEAHARHNLGLIYSRLGDRARAIELYTRALSLRREIGDPATIGTTLQNLGAAYLLDGDYGRAQMAIDEALDFKRRGSDRFGEASVLAWLVRLDAAQGAFDRAREHGDAALTISRAIGDPGGEASALLQLAGVEHQIGDLTAASARAEEALKINRAQHNQTNEAATLFLLATIDAQQGGLASASARLDVALERVEAVRARAPTPELRSTYLADHQRYFDLAIDVLMRRHAQAPDASLAIKAFELTERGRARRLLEVLAAARVDLRAAGDAALLDSERNASERVEAREAARTRLAARRASDDQIAAAGRDVAEALNELTTIREQMKRSNPALASLVAPGPLALPELQRRTLDADTILLDYWVGADRSYLWIVSATGLTTHILPPRAQLETAVRTIRSLVTARQEHIAGETATAARARVAAADAALPGVSASLADTLFGPALRMPAAKRWLIVPDGPLEYLPFGLLPVPGSAGRARAPLMTSREFVLLPSASALATLRAEARERPAAAGTVAVFADPVFAADDVRVTAANAAPLPPIPAAATAIATGPDALRSARELGLEFPRLTFSRGEADAITALAPRGSVATAVDFAANRGAATAEALRDFRILHFATHAVVNADQPEMSGIVLSLVDQDGRPQNGFLRLHDLYTMRLRSSLVVLSACQTALGKQIRGDGLAGMSRGFMYAGASSVLASLWRVDDRATSELMQRFYRRVLTEGLTPAAALRGAVAEMSAEPRWRAPYYWAGFVLQGEWR